MTNIKTLRVLHLSSLFSFGNRKRAAWTEDAQDCAAQGRSEGVRSAHDRMRTLACAVVAGALCLLFVGPAVSLAQAASPWWHLTSGSRPTSLQPGSAQNEVQEVTVSATTGDFYFEDPVTQNRDLLPPLPFSATHQEAQAALEGIFGAGNVEVTGGPGDEVGTNPYLVGFTGELAAKPVALVAKSFPLTALGFSPLEGGTHGNGEKAIQVAEKAHGQGDGQIVLTAANLGDAEVNAGANSVSIADALPPGLEALGIEGEAHTLNGEFGLECSLALLTCTYAGTHENGQGETVPNTLPPMT